MGSEVVWVSRDSRVLATCKVRNRIEIFGCDNVVGDSGAELLGLATNVSQEGIARPLSNEHDSEHWDSGKLHGHRGSRSDQVGSHIHCLVAKNIFTDVSDYGS
jgi:hypothetical protein